MLAGAVEVVGMLRCGRLVVLSRHSVSSNQSGPDTQRTHPGTDPEVVTGRMATEWQLFGD